MPTPEPTIDNRTGPYTFYFGPFRFTSELDIPELRDSRGPGQRSVAIHLGNVPRHIENATPFGNYCEVAPAEYLLEVPDTARYYVGHGNDVRVDIRPGAPIANVSTFLLGSIFGVLCHQNGLLPLHASAVEHNGHIVAFVGDSGAGKSTLAACLQQRGYRIVSDDICLLESTADAIHVLPVAGWLKLWNQSLQHLGETPVEQHRVFSTDDKFRKYLPPSDVSPSQLSRVLFLARAPENIAASQSRPELQPLPIADAIAGLIETTYAGYVPELMGQRARVFRTCARVFEQAEAFRLTVPWDLSRIDSTLDLLEAEVFRPLNGAATSAS